MHYLKVCPKLTTSEDPEIKNLKNEVDFTKRIILVTGHRRENHGQGFINICECLKRNRRNW